MNTITYQAFQVPIFPDLTGKVAVVTGSSSGTGAEVCRMLAANRVKVVVNGRHQPAIDRLVTEIRTTGGEAVGIVADCTQASEVAQLYQKTMQTWGTPDILAAFAGGSGTARPGPLPSIRDEDWHSAITANLSATYLTLKAFIPAMLAAGRGSIITMASTAARQPTPEAPLPYSAAKAGIIQLTKQVAQEAAFRQVRLNCLAPSTILTERIAHYMDPDQQQAVAATHPLGRLGRPADVALATLFLASDASSWLTGITLDIAGGKTMLY
ncbi:SDR family NAD(P)-dependent oxidoreductase [Spirosoma fluminis]